MSDLLVLCYHAISPSWDTALSVTPASFEAQLRSLARRGYRGARFSEALAANGAERLAVVTFDDAYSSVLALAKPALDRHGYPATVFVPTDWPGTARPMRWQGIEQWHPGEHAHELTPLSWEQLRELAHGGWEIGSHTCSHPHLPRLEERELARELTASKARIEAELDLRCTSIAYPYGDVDARVADAARAAGYEWGCTIPRVLAKPAAMLWPRAAIYHDDDMRRFAAKVSPTLRRLRTSAPGGAIDRLRIAAAERLAGASRRRAA